MSSASQLLTTRLPPHAQPLPNYPLCYPASPYDLDLERSNAIIDSRKKSLFCEDDATDVEMVVVNNEEGVRERVSRYTIESLKDFQAVDTEGRSSLISISQISSWSRFLISRDLFSHICDVWRIHPRFLNIVRMFGEKLRADEESFNTSYVRHSVDQQDQAGQILRGIFGDVYEWMYCIKYVEEHHRDAQYLDDPFSIRATGVHVRWSATSKLSSWTLLSPSEIIQDRLEEILKSWSKGGSTASAADICRTHAAIILQSSENWRSYINFLEKRFDDTVIKGFYSKPNPPMKGAISTDFKDIRALHITSDKLRKISQILDVNLRTARHIQSWTDRLARLPFADALGFEACSSDMELFFIENETHKSRVDSILSRCDSISSLISRILEFRNNQTSENNAMLGTDLNKSMKTLSEEALKENKEMRKLTTATLADTRAMKTLSAIAGFFLPATFVATLFGSNFFGFDEQKGMTRVSKNFWIYWVVTLPIFLMTIMIWHVFKDRESPSRDESEDEERAESFKAKTED